MAIASWESCFKAPSHSILRKLPKGLFILILHPANNRPAEVTSPGQLGLELQWDPGMCPGGAGGVVGEPEGQKEGVPGERHGPGHRAQKPPEQKQTDAQGPVWGGGKGGVLTRPRLRVLGPAEEGRVRAGRAASPGSGGSPVGSTSEAARPAGWVGPAWHLPSRPLVRCESRLGVGGRGCGPASRPRSHLPLHRCPSPFGNRRSSEPLRPSPRHTEAG